MHIGSKIGHSLMFGDKPIHNTNAASTAPKQGPPPKDQRLQTLVFAIGRWQRS